MKDIQAQFDNRNILIDKIGISDLELPIILSKNKNKQEFTSATLSLFVDLIATQRGVHMSRLVELLHYFSKHSLSQKSALEFLEIVQKQTNSEKVFFNAEFTYFVNKKSPVSKKNSFMNYKCNIFSYANKRQKQLKYKVKVPVLSLCPCSLAISKIGAHNQRSEVELSIIPKNNEWFDDFIRLIEKSASNELFSILKRVDEKHVIDYAINNPCFAEDIVREISLGLKKKKYKTFLIQCKNYESIHNHNVFAEISCNPKKWMTF